MNYTPGPWEQAHRKGDDKMYRTQVFSEKYGTIATLAWTPQDFGNGVIGTYREANARLIASAPELLEACKVALEREYLEVELSSIRARERDRNHQTAEAIILDRKNKNEITDRLRTIDSKIRAAIAKAEGGQL